MTIGPRFLALSLALSPGLALAQQPAGPALKTVFEGEFLVGGALNPGRSAGGTHQARRS